MKYKNLIDSNLDSAIKELVKVNKDIILKNIDRKINDDFVELRVVKVEEYEDKVVIYYGIV